jgi:hypothetical protein
MANTITAIIPTLQTSANKVAREGAGFVQACYKNVDATRAGYNQTLNYPIVPALTAAAVTPTNVSSSGTDIVQEAGTIVMDNLRKVSWNWTGEQTRALMNGDIAPFKDIYQQTLDQAFRTLVNEIESSLWVAAYKGASRGTGSAGTAPFATAADFTDFANVAQILDENGTPISGRKLVIGSAAINNLRAKQSSLFKVNEAGSAEFLRTGNLGTVMGFNMHYSFPIAAVTKGTGASATTDNAGYAVGAKTLTLASAGTGTILAGDIVTFAGDSNKYVVKTGDSDVSNGGTIVLNNPGLKVAMSAATKAITVGNNYTPNVAFHESALHLVMRAPEDGMDGAQDVVNIRDDFSGLQFQLARYGQYMQSSWELRCLYGVKSTQGEFTATLIG